ncbi:MAG: NAD(P)/FAD-dependent oxidoreductase [Christensenellales bacterium]|jgi:predicted Rossmann fold flavoprotein
MSLIVIGAGPAGMICAGAAAERTKGVKLIERNEKLGKKLYITGKGRCNVTNNCSIDFFILNVITNPKFLHSAIYAFTPADAIAFYENQGIKLKVERGGRVFPESDKSNDIIKAHIKHLNDNNVEIMLNTRVKSLIIEGGAVKGVALYDGSTLMSDAVVIASGGVSYPATGSTGDGYILARQAEHSIIAPKPALTPLILKERIDSEGLSLKNVRASVINSNNKVIASEFGEMLFTDNGVSGPIILTLSSRINKLNDKLRLSIDLKPALTHEQLDLRILRDFSDLNNRDFINSLSGLLPKSLIPEVVKRSGIDPRIKVNEINRNMRLNLIKIIKDLNFTISGLDIIDNAIVTSGGVNVKEVNPGTMQSKLVSGLYFAGEVLDYDALTGGFNIQAALSTGYLAGISAAKLLAKL